ncbi:LuxR family transcriptional regulator [Streptomyces sp. SLBN-118]|uniref:helix-turn-helix transcriptional regulator n=1 Tax=Streptomyces sp. SLBN-118 TaxID=2768454 RepID=UPI0011507B16|nr:LuxR family transcriptional regulator [Streptomyces sp. SLBN-118]
MAVFGLSQTEEAIYRHFLRNPGTSDDDIHLLLEISPHQARESVNRLCAVGVLSRTESNLLSAVSPETAVDRLTELRLRELHKEFEHVIRSRHLVSELRTEQGPKAVAPHGVERLQSLPQIRNRIDDLAFFAREEILSVEPHTALTPENISRARRLDQRCLRRGVRMRSVVRKEALEHPPTLDYLRELAAQGAVIRVAEDVSERILVYDRRAALVPRDPADTTRGALLAHEEGLVASIVALFEKIWDQAEDLSGSVDGQAGADDGPGPGDIERRVLQWMCQGHKDEIGARALGISIRTYRRHVAELLRLLGASSRPHAALVARERGWI